MNMIKKALCLFLITLLAIGACGCMNHEEYSKKILNELNNRYDKEFEIVKLTYEVSGNAGNFYRAVCKEKGSEKTFVSYYYLNGSDYLLSESKSISEEKSGDKPLLVDEYVNFCLAEMYSDYISELDSSILFVTAEVSFNENSPSYADLEKGLEYCLSANNFKTLVKVYVFVKSDISEKTLFENELINSASNFNVYQQSLDFAYINENSSQDLRDKYLDDTYMIRDRIKSDDSVIRYIWFLMESEKGITNQKVVKGE